MLDTIKQTIKKYQLLERGETVVVALSGGADSCALLLAMKDLAPLWNLKLIVAHFNHDLRGIQSAEDEVFCQNLAEQFKFPFVTEKMKSPVVPKGVSAEDYYRQKRYAFLDQVAGDSKAAKIALGHHLHDQVETVLMNLLRGSGLDGLKGFLPIRERCYIRPLMEISRKEIKTYLARAGIAHREDLSNQNTAYLRNRIRQELIPFLQQKYNPAIEKNLVRMADILRRDDAFINECVNEVLALSCVSQNKDEVSFSAGDFKSLHDAIGYRFIKALLEGLVTGGKGFSYAHIRAVRDLALECPTGKVVALPYNLRARKEYDRIIIDFIGEKMIPDYEYPVFIPGTVALKERGITLTTRLVADNVDADFSSPGKVYFDLDKIQEPLVVRNRRTGDWFEPLGMKGRQKIKKLFIDRKIPLARRAETVLVADRESVIWIENLHLSERVKVSHETRNLLVLEISYPDGRCADTQENI